MLDARAAMTTPAKDPNLVDEICFLQKVLFLLSTKIFLDTPTILMKSYLFTLVIFLAIAVRKCHKEKETIPACIQQKIEAIKKEPVWNPPAEVYAYNYKGEVVYYFTANCCDQYNIVYDKNCAYICAPSGGITGKGDGKCADFLSSAQKIKLVWRDER